MAKKSMSVYPSPIDQDGGTHYPDDGDPNWNRNDFPWKWNGEWGYRIKRVTNDTTYRPGLCLAKWEVDELIAEGWTVSVLSHGR